MLQSNIPSWNFTRGFTEVPFETFGSLEQRNLLVISLVFVLFKTMFYVSRTCWNPASKGPLIISDIKSRKIKSSSASYSQKKVSCHCSCCQGLKAEDFVLNFVLWRICNFEAVGFFLRITVFKVDIFYCFFVACITGTLWAHWGESGILRGVRPTRIARRGEESKIKRLLPVVVAVPTFITSKHERHYPKTVIARFWYLSSLSLRQNGGQAVTFFFTMLLEEVLRLFPNVPDLKHNQSLNLLFKRRDVFGLLATAVTFLNLKVLSGQTQLLLRTSL